MNKDSTDWKLNFLLQWVINNTAGFGGGAVLGEYIGQLIEKQFGWQLGILTAGIIFEAVIWVMRFLTIKDTKGFGSFRPLDTIIWLSAEGVGLILAEGAYSVTKTNILVIGPMVGSVLGAFILILLWIITIPSTRKRFWAIQSILYGIIGIFVLSFGLSLTFVLIQEIANIFSRAMNQFWGLGIFSVFTGAFIGTVTGIAYVKLKAIRAYEPDAI